ncbi:probable alkaline/neutral invertase F [Chenopodium quinoa]|uniref:Alkaline/neutral invertase n=1 Tax=Chenopodium quinoa TaxID=63459 RepID=A0A803KZQ2_CHEQI|nr:probable alkaline/neutral invertase F [Chenopodium quinoa]
MASIESDNNNLIPEEITEIPPPPEKPHSPSLQRHVAFSVVNENEEIDNNNSSSAVTTTEESASSSENPDTGGSEQSSITVDSVCLEATLRPVSVRSSTSAANLESLCEQTGSAGKCNGNTPKSGGAVKSNGANGYFQHPIPIAEHPMVKEAWSLLEKSYVYYKGISVGTVAASDPSAEALNYNQVFVRDFVPSALACLMKDPPDTEIVKNFLLKTLHLQSREKRIDNFTLGEGVMPASFKVVIDEKNERVKEILEADYGGTAIGRVAPMDSGFWWIILLRSYVKSTSDRSLADQPDVQKGMKLILDLCLSDGFDTFPSLLCADACCMIDRRMGIYGYPIEIQALFFFALRCAKNMLKEVPDNKELLDKINSKIKALSYHIRTYYWLDYTQLNNIYRYKTEEYSHTALNKFNVSPESIPDWLFEFMPLRGGYFIGNVSPARMDFRWFLLGNCIAILSSLATPKQASAIMDLIEARWDELVGEMPLKISYPALEGNDWNIITGFDSKNTRWSYHNGGSWPVLLWLLVSACIKTARPQMARNAIELVEKRLSNDGWPEYYDGKTGRYIGKQARKFQTWSISGYLVAKKMLENPANLLLVSLEEDKTIAKPKLIRSASWSN